MDTLKFYHTGNAEKFHCYLTDRYLETDPVQKEKRKEKEKNLKVIHAYEEKQRKVREAIAKREAEKLRKRRLSKAERDREASEKRRIKFLNKQQKEADELRRYGEALQACGGEERLQMMGAVESHESSTEDENY